MSMQAFIDLASAQFSRSVWPAALETVKSLQSASITPDPSASLLADESWAISPPEQIEVLIRRDGALNGLGPTLGDVFRDMKWHKSPRSGTAFTQVVGPGSTLHHDQVRFGLFLLPGGSDYPNHVHGADEIYIVAVGQGEWSIDNRPYQTKVPGDIVEIPSMTIHALRSPEESVLMFWSWTGDITLNRYRFTD